MYTPSEQRYQSMIYNQCGKSGLKLPALSLGMWHNFGGVDIFENGRKILLKAFDYGITHFDLANNYGPPAGSAEEHLGKTLKQDLNGYRDEIIISTKAGYGMWDGPYGNGGSKKYLVASLNQSLKRVGVDYVDIFYHHCFDPETPMEETMEALSLIHKQGKALYIGISNYNSEQTKQAIKILNNLNTPILIHQPKYSMLDRWVEKDSLLNTLQDNGIGSIAFSPLAQGLLTNKYLKEIPEGSRAAKPHGFLQKEEITDTVRKKLNDLNNIAKTRNQSLAQMAIAWLLKDHMITSVLIGASSSEQLSSNINALKNISFENEELKKIETILNS